MSKRYGRRPLAATAMLDDARRADNTLHRSHRADRRGGNALRRFRHAVAAGGLGLALALGPSFGPSFGPPLLGIASAAESSTAVPLWDESNMSLGEFREIARAGYPISKSEKYDPIAPIFNLNFPHSERTAVGITLVRWSDGLSVPAAHVQWRSTKGLVNTRILLEAVDGRTGEVYHSSTTDMREAWAKEGNLFVVSCRQFRAGEVRATVLVNGSPRYSVSIPVYPA